MQKRLQNVKDDNKRKVFLTGHFRVQNQVFV